MKSMFKNKRAFLPWILGILAAAGIALWGGAAFINSFKPASQVPSMGLIITIVILVVIVSKIFK